MTLVPNEPPEQHRTSTEGGVESAYEAVRSLSQEQKRQFFFRASKGLVIEHEDAVAFTRGFLEESNSEEFARVVVEALTKADVSTKKEIAVQILESLALESKEPAALSSTMTRIEIYTERKEEPTSFVVKEVTNGPFEGIPQWVRFKDEHDREGWLYLNPEKVTLITTRPDWKVARSFPPRS